MASIPILSSMPLTKSSPLQPLMVSVSASPLLWSASTSTTTFRRRKHCPLRISASSLTDSSPLLKAAHHTVDTYIRSGMVVGLGSGQASTMAIQYLGQQLRTGAFKDIVGIDFAFDDADVIEEGTLIAIIGRQSSRDESLVQEKSILNAAENLVFMISKNQYKSGLEGSIPVLVDSLNWLEPAEEIDDLFLGDAEVWRRPSIGHADPLGGDFPFITREGHNVLDLIFTSPILSLEKVAESLDKIDGVVDHGIISKFL
ncbi:hypothetical protein F8388_024851 [Cannabis sativa]|nr:hypothetical protein F8388_024851 [Cannabis sativa]